MLIGWREVGTDAPEPGTLGMSTLACHSNGLGQNLGGLSFAVSTRGPASEPKVKSVKSLSHVRLFATPWTIAYQAPPSVEFSRQEYQSGLPFPSPGDLPNPGIEPGLLLYIQTDTLPPEPPKARWLTIKT